MDAIEKPRHPASFVYRLHKLQHLHITHSLPPKEEMLLYTLLLFKEAQGSLGAGDKNYALKGRQIFILPPHTRTSLYLRSAQSASYYHILFYAHPPNSAEGQLTTTNESELDGFRELNPIGFDLLLEMVQGMEKDLEQTDLWGPTKANIRFQEMIMCLLGQQLADKSSDLKQAICSTKLFMEQNYNLSITRERLADLAGISPDYYSRMFKRETGKSPMEFLNHIRIKKAKQLLLASGSKLSTIARKVGFHDEFYFSRKFKEISGCSPTLFLKQMRSNP